MYAGFEQVLQLRLCHAGAESSIRVRVSASTAFISRAPTPQGHPGPDPAVCEMRRRTREVTSALRLLPTAY